MDIIGRKFEREKMTSLCDSGQAQFWVVYGRRRIGKTFLVREFFKRRECAYCAVTGEKGRKTDRQLSHFQTAIEKTFFDGERLPSVKNWDDAFEQLSTGLRLQSRSNPKKELVIFLDELPWLAARKSGLLGALDHAWNTELQYMPNLRLVICGSAASWMIENVVLNKGGLHNRLTGTFRVEPFTLTETRDYLRQIRNCSLSEAQILELYMSTGGVPYYLSFVRNDYSAAQNIGYLFFGKGELSDEFEKLFAPLFDKSEIHTKIVRNLSACSHGMIREEIVKTAGISAGRQTSVALKELEEAGFIGRFKPINRKSRENIYKLTDEFCLFHFKWIETAPSRHFLSSGLDYWLQQMQSAAFSSWAGIAFESTCLKHAPLIIKKLGFSAVSCKIGPWVYHALGKEKQRANQGAQIDLLFERADRVATVTEMKYYNKEFVLSKEYRTILQRKMDVYKAVAKNNFHVSLAIVSPYGVKQNEHSNGFVSGVVVLEDLFER
jgi:AAA+ ATPase superfamily predicted ATPase